MGKPIQAKPPYFRQCPTCHKEFGSRSIQIHVARCQDKHAKGGMSSTSDPDSSDLNDTLIPNDSATKMLASAAKQAAMETSTKRSITRQNTRTIKPEKAPSRKYRTTRGNSVSDDEIETSLSDELSASWPANKFKKDETKQNVVTDKARVRRSKRKRDRKRDESERPKTATLPRPSILDESLKDKLDMTLTKKELLAAVKLCSDVAVQRGLPNMRVRPSRNFIAKNRAAHPVKLGQNANSGVGMIKIPRSKKSTSNKQESSTSGSSTSVSPYMSNSPSKGMKHQGRRKTMQRPVTSSLSRPSKDGLELPHIHILPQNFHRSKDSQSIHHPISQRLSRRFRAKNKRSEPEPPPPTRSRPKTVIDPDVINANIRKTMNEINMFRRVSRGPSSVLRIKPDVVATHEKKESVPEPCRSCGRNDLPERLHTHHSLTEKKDSKIPIRLESPPKKMEKLEQTLSPSKKKDARPWVSPTAKRKDKRSMSMDSVNLSPLRGARSSGSESSPRYRQKPEKKRPASTTTIKLVEISDESDDSVADLPVVHHVHEKTESPSKKEAVTKEQVIREKTSSLFIK